MARTTPVHSGYTIINGTTTGSNGSKCDTWIEYKVTSQSVVNNTSTLVAYLYTCANYSNSTSYSSTANYGYLTYDNGTKQYTSISGYDFTNQTPVLFASYTFTIAHNTDGTKQITLQGAWSTSHSSYISGGNVSGQVTLPQIARASTVSNMTTYLGTAGTINITRQSSSFTHTLTYTFGNSTGTIATKTSSTSVSWTPPVSLIAEITNASSKTGTITCETFSGNTSVGTSTSTLTLKVPNSTLANVSGLLGSSASFSINNVVTTQLTFTVQYTVGNTTTTIQTKGSRNVTYTFPASLLTQMPNRANGTGTISVTTYNGTKAIDTITATLTLIIPPASSTNVTATMGVQCTIPITKIHANLEVDISYSFANTTDIIAMRWVGNSVDYTFDVDTFAPLVPNATSGSGTITLTTYNGTATVGTAIYTFELLIPTALLPTASLQASIYNSNPTIEGWGNIGVQGYSRVDLELTGAGIKGSKITTMTVSGLGVNRTVNYNTTTATLTTQSSIINNKGILYYETDVVDSRGKHAITQSRAITIYEYSPPTIDVTSLKRCQQDGTEDSSGRWLLPVFTYDYKTCDNHNTASTYVRYKKANANAWETPVAITTDTPANLDLDPQYNYIIQPYISDALNTTYAAEISVPSAQRILNINASGKGLAIGGFSQNSGEFEVFYPSDFDSTVNIDGAVTMNDGASVTNGLGADTINATTSIEAPSILANGYDLLNSLVYKGTLTSSDNLNDITDTGIYYITSSVPSNAPDGATTYSTVLVIHPEGSFIQQVYIRPTLTQGLTHLSMRQYSGSTPTWSIWRAVNDMPFAKAIHEIGANDDLNDFTDTGVYFCANSATTQSLSHSPITDGVWVDGATGFRLEVYNTTGTGYGFQILYTHNVVQRTYMRALNGSTWRTWRRIIGDDEIYYRNNDTLSITTYTDLNGFITSSTTSVSFSFYTPKSLANIASVSVTAFKGTMRGGSGYLDSKTSAYDWFADSAYTITATIISDNMLRIVCTKSSAYTNVTNNTPVSYYGSLGLTFSTT